MFGDDILHGNLKLIRLNLGSVSEKLAHLKADWTYLFLTFRKNRG